MQPSGIFFLLKNPCPFGIVRWRVLVRSSGKVTMRRPKIRTPNFECRPRLVPLDPIEYRPHCFENQGKWPRLLRVHWATHSARKRVADRLPRKPRVNRQRHDKREQELLANIRDRFEQVEIFLDNHRHKRYAVVSNHCQLVRTVGRKGTRGASLQKSSPRRSQAP